MWYYDSKIIKTPKAMVISGITHPPGIFRDSTMLTSLGIKPYREVTPDNRYYTPGSYSVDTSGDEVVGTYAGAVRVLATLRADMLEKTETHVAIKQAEIDWYWTRAAKGGTAVPSAISTYATALYSEHETKKTEIAALNTIAKIKEYEARAYTMVKKDAVYNGDGSFKEWHASNTSSVAQAVNMVLHYSTHPNKVEAWFVSLTAD